MRISKLLTAVFLAIALAAGLTLLFAAVLPTESLQLPAVAP